MELLKPVTGLTLTDAVEEKIYEYIRSNHMLPGDPLPKEQELAKALDVSRHIVREALSRLRMLGIVKSKKKKGMTISQPDAFIGFERMVSMDILDDKSQNELMELRLILELGMTDYIYNRKTDKDIIELEKIVATDTNDLVEPSDVFSVEIAFHSKLYEIAGNVTLQRLQGILYTTFQISRKKSEGADKKKTSPTHREICEVLKNGTKEEFREIIWRHLETPRQKTMLNASSFSDGAEGR